MRLNSGRLSSFHELIKVTINKTITVKYNNNTKIVVFIGPSKAKPNKNKYSILSTFGITIIGYKVGDIVNWPTNEGEISFEILKVEDILNK